MAEQPNFIHQWVDGYFVAAHNAVNPSAAEWEAYVNDTAQHRAALKATLVYTEGGSPSAVQRKQLRDVLVQGTIIPCAILTSSVVARAAITAFNLFLDNTMKAFPPSDAKEALRYMKVPERQWPQLEETLKLLKNKVGAR